MSESDIEGITMDARNAFAFKLHLDMGGDGYAFELVPFWAYESTGDYGFNALGLEINFFMWRLRFGDFYPHFGLGFFPAYLTGGDVDKGLELFGHVPIGCTWYPLDDLGVVAELGINYGATGFKMKGLEKSDFKFGSSVGIDFMVGVRWP